MKTLKNLKKIFKKIILILPDKSTLEFSLQQQSFNCKEETLTIPLFS
jgi:hypothetical protein